MSAILEPETATWWERRGNLDEVAYYPRVKVVACPEDRCVTLIREYPGTPVQTESIELKLESLAEIEALLLNARLWLERAVRQRDELRAAEEVAADAEPLAADNPWQSLGHPSTSAQAGRVIANLMMLAARR